MKKDHTEIIHKSYGSIQKSYRKCMPYGNCTDNIQKTYRKCAKICNDSNNELVLTNESLQILAHFLYVFCMLSVQFPYGIHFLYDFCMLPYDLCMISVWSFFIGMQKNSYFGHHA